MASRMIIFSVTEDLPAVGQVFTIGSITWEITPNGEGIIIEVAPTASDHPAAAQPVADPILGSFPEALRSTPSSEFCRPIPYRPQRNIQVDDLIASIDRVDERIEGCLSLIESVRRTVDDADEQPSVGNNLELVITSTPEGRMVVARPASSALALRSAPRQDSRSTRFGLVNIAALYQESANRLFHNQLTKFNLDLTSRPLIAPAVSMVEIEDLHGESLINALEEPVVETDSDDGDGSDGRGNPNFTTPGATNVFAGNIFMISNDEPTIEGENPEDRQARVGRNANRSQWRAARQADAGVRQDGNYSSRYRCNRPPRSHDRYQTYACEKETLAATEAHEREITVTQTANNAAAIPRADQVIPEHERRDVIKTDSTKTIQLVAGDPSKTATISANLHPK